MKDHSVSIETVGGKTELRFAPVFNAGAAFIDRHTDEATLDKVFLRTTDGEQVTYRTLADQVNRCGNALLDVGLRPGERMLMVVKDCPEFAYLFWGAIKAGIIPVPLSTLLGEREVRSMIDDSRAGAVIFSPEFSDAVQRGARAADHKPALFLPTIGEGDSIAGLIQRASASLRVVPTAPGDDCFWLYSSGSTGGPKGVVHAHRSMAVVAHHSGVEGLGITPDDVIFSASKLSFAYGLGNSLHVPLWVGAGSVLAAPKPTPELVFEVIEKFRPTVFFSVPTLFVSLLNALETREADLSSLRLCLSSGEALPPALFHRWRERTGQPLLEVMGTTESCYCFFVSHANACKAGFAGLVAPGHEARIVGQDGRDVERGTAGQLLIRSQASAKHYWDQPEKTAQTMLEGGWLKTGDTFLQDEEGYFQCRGRNDDMMKVGGIWCSPFEIEGKLMEHDKVLETAVVARADGHDLIKPEAWVVLKNPQDACKELEEELVEHCRDGLAPYKFPRWFNFVEELPKTVTGKIQRVKLRKMPPSRPEAGG